MTMAPKKTDTTRETADMDRRNFLSTTAAVGGAMVVGFFLPPTCAQAQSQSVSDTQPLPPLLGQHVPAQMWYREAMVPELNAWITIAPDDTVTMRINQTEI